jgi:gliding motility-associated-like protein
VQYAGEECSSYQKFGLVLDMRKNIITPNDDGFNDKWTVKRLDTFEGQNSQLKIFDRYYNTIYEQTSNIQLEWDGKQFGRPVPTSTYWYIMKLPDGREFTGYIVVKNRD